MDVDEEDITQQFPSLDDLTPARDTAISKLKDPRSFTEGATGAVTVVRAPSAEQGCSLGRLTQTALQRACRRIGKSSSGSKNLLIKRLEAAAYRAFETVKGLAKEFEGTGASVQELQPSRKRALNWKANETARLAHVLVDPSKARALTRMVTRASREELDVGIHDPWSNECVKLFNRKEFVPEAPEISGGAVHETIDSLDPGVVKHERDAGKL
jgi:hypothetical protein